MILQALGVVVVGAAAFQVYLVIAAALKRLAAENEQRRVALELLQERVTAARKLRHFEEALQTLSWNGYRKFVVARKVLEDSGAAEPAAPFEGDEAAPAWSKATVIIDSGNVQAAFDQMQAASEEGPPKLVREHPPEVYTIEKDQVVVGRSKTADIVIDNGTVSVRHARIFRKGPDWFLQDLESLNGTLVNMEVVKGVPVQLHPNDHIRLAAVDFKIQLPVKKTAAGRLPQICSFYLVPHDTKPLPPFMPGQYLTFQLRIPGVEKTTIRCYSLSECARPDHYRVTIKRVPAPKDKPDLRPGLSSNFFHDQVREGDILDIQAPRGGFHLDLSKDTPVVLIGGGIGVTPVLSMLNAIVSSGSKRETWFYYGVRNASEHIMKDHLEAIARDNDHVHLNVCYSEPTPNDVKGRDYHHAERVTIELMKKLLPANNYEFYTCGPPPMMNQITEDLLAWGVPEAHIHYEAFGPATVKKVSHNPPAAATASDAPALKVTFARSGKECAWEASAASLLEFAEAQGVQIDSGCRAGNCGTCLTAVRSGQFSYNIEPGAPAGPGTCLTCISVPKGDIVLDA
jgi:uncharacterized protein